ncbi:alpha/beta-hydrolase [Cristinia sonorae]|uniref:Alpha/beta-hydrolase n=1 Tax=Cristinia sonorae TaxID=1940300 RepID=A0A8K0UQ52_9AGAR|nr:alpha/beta-hydrolase [Cristinia sonorae]
MNSSWSVAAKCFRCVRHRPHNLSWQTRFAHTKTINPVELDYEVHIPPGGNKTEQPMVVLHGLFGNKKNWSSLAKAFSRDLGRAVYSLDLRNHGSSPHAMPMSYDALATDVLHFCQQHSLRNVSLLGHSMGGKTAMAFALNPELPEGMLNHLIVVDIAPAKGALSNEFQAYIDAMISIEKSGIKSRKEANDLLTPHEPDPMVRAFLLTNLLIKSHGPQFRVPLDMISSSIPDLGSFPYNPGEKKWEGPSLFLKGTKSKYINHHNVPVAEKFFPDMKLVELDAGHWVQAERPHEVKQAVLDFIRQK